jgi:hypothetical protein
VSQLTRLFSPAALIATTVLAGIASRSASSEPQRGAPPGAAAIEHKLLEKYVGARDAEVSMAGLPGRPTVKTPGKATARLVGGVWRFTDFESSIMGMPFTGRELLGYDLRPHCSVVAGTLAGVYFLPLPRLLRRLAAQPA